MTKKSVKVSTEKEDHAVQWDMKIGPASIIGVIQIIGMIAGLGVLYGTMSGQITTAATNAIEAKAAIKDAEKKSEKRDEKVATQSEKIGKIETAVQYMGVQLQRIESAVAKP